MDQMGAWGPICLDVQPLHRILLGRLSRLGLRLVQSWKLHLSGGEQPAPVLEVVAVLNQHFLFLKAVEKMWERVEAQLLYLLL